SKTTYNWDYDRNCLANPVTEACVPKADAGTGNSATTPEGFFNIPASACANASVVATHAALTNICEASNRKGGRFMPDQNAALGVYMPYDQILYNTNPTNYMLTPNRRIQLFSAGDMNLGSEARAFFETSYV